MSKLAGDTDARGPAKIVDIKDNKIIFDAEQLEDVLKDYGNKKIAVIAVAGAYRTGKSFLLSYIMKALTSSNESWIGDTDRPLDRWFPWKSGSSRMTTGIDLWTEPIPFKLKSGEEIGVILMDTQGTVDPKSKTKESAAVFALSTLLSSLLIFNLRATISLDDLQNLQMWLGYGKLALEEQNIKPFQDMMFLVRDWQYQDEHNYGKDGGRQYIKKLFTQIPENEHKELKNIQTEIEQCFTNMSGFLLPHPGLSVPFKPEFDGSLKGLEGDFVQHLVELLQLLISEHIKMKSINGAPLTGKDLLSYFKGYATLFENGKMPEPLSILEANASVFNTLAVEKCIEAYRREMEKHMDFGKPLDTNGVTEIHTKATQNALNVFGKVSKLGDSVTIERFRKQLLQKIMKKFKNYEERNKAKMKQEVVCVAVEQTKMYFLGMTTMLKKYSICVPPNELMDKHTELRDTALEALAKYREVAEAEYKRQKSLLINAIEQMFETYNHQNEERLTSVYKNACTKARNHYQKCMQKTLEEGYVTPDDLLLKHTDLKIEAFDNYDVQCISHGAPVDEAIKMQLSDKIGQDFINYQRKNNDNNKHDNMKLVVAAGVGLAVGATGVAGATYMFTTAAAAAASPLLGAATPLIEAASAAVPVIVKSWLPK